MVVNAYTEHVTLARVMNVEAADGSVRSSVTRMPAVAIRVPAGTTEKGGNWRRRCAGAVHEQLWQGMGDGAQRVVPWVGSARPTSNVGREGELGWSIDGV